MEFLQFPPEQPGDVRFSSQEIAGCLIAYRVIASEERRIQRILDLAEVAGDTIGNSLSPFRLEQAREMGNFLANQIEMDDEERGIFKGTFISSAVKVVSNPATGVRNV